MASIECKQQGSGNSSMKLRVTYTPGQGGMTITKLEGYRDSYGPTTGNPMTVYVDGAQIHKGTVTFGKTSWTSFWTGSYWVGSSAPVFTFSGSANSNIKNSKFTASVGSYSVVVRIANMDCYGNYATPWVWINTWVTPGASVDYWGYGNSAGPDNNTNNVVHYSNGSVGGNIDTTVYSSRRTYGFDLNIYDPNGGQPWDTGAAGTVEYSDNNGGSYTRVSNEPTSAHYIGRPIKIRNISPGTGMALNYVAQAYVGSGTSTTLSPSGGVYTFTQPDQTSHLNVYMKWASYTLTANPNGGKLKGGNFGTDDGKAVSHGVTTTYNSTNYYILGTATKDNTTSTRTVTYNANGGTCSTASQNSTATVTYPFKGWYSATSGGTQHFNSAGTAIQGTGLWNTSNQWVYAGNYTVYAQFDTSTGAFSAITSPTPSKASTSATRTVTFNANGGTCSTATLNSTQTTTYTQNGWWTAASGGTQVVKANTSYTPSATQTVYAQYTSSAGSWSAVTLPSATKANGSVSCTVTYNANGGSCSTTSATSNATVTYSQTGWWTATSGGTNRGKAGATYTPSAAETVYAQFSSSQGAYSAVTLPTPTRTGYKFKGWSTSSTATSGSTGSYTPTGNVTLYATWEAVGITVYVNVNGTWKVGTPYVNVNGTWKQASALINVNGTWKSS